MKESIISNPFVGCTARDMKYEEVSQYWCSPFDLYKINEGELFTSRTPIVIEGVRGTGKTMILKYLSYFVQKDFIKDSSIDQTMEYFEKRCIGVYFRYKDDFCHMFDNLDCDWQAKERIFIHYYELFILRQILEILDDIYQNQNNSQIEEVVCSFLDISVRSLNEVRQHINSMLRKMDEIINSSGFDEAWKEKLMPLLGKGNLVTEFIQTINNQCNGWENILFVILLDEYENLGLFQTLVNTLIKQVDDTANLTYRLGMRPAGMDNNNKTNVAGEHLQIDRDFLLRRLEYENFGDYKKFALEISQKRLESVEVFRENGLCDINNILGKNENFDEEAEQVVKGGKKHFKLIREFYSPEMMDDVIHELSCSNKLMEMYNILRVLRGEDYKKTASLCREYQSLRENGQSGTAGNNELHKYYLDYSNKYRVALLYMLLTIYGEQKLYYSVNTFLRLSSGSINDFISLCRNTFKQINEKMLQEIRGGEQISPRIQTYASLDTAEDQRRKVSMSNRFGKEMYTFIDNMGSIFEEYHRDMQARYPETNQFAFANENEIRNDDRMNAYFVELINSGAVIRKQRRQMISVGKTRGAVYQLNRIYAPIYQYSYRTRGGFNVIIGRDDFETMLKKSIDPKKYIGNNSWSEQCNLFDNPTEDEDDSADL